MEKVDDMEKMDDMEDDALVDFKTEDLPIHS